MHPLLLRLIAFFLTSASLFAAGTPVFRAGAATGNITPDLGTLIIGGFSPTPAREIHDELHVRTLVLDDGNQQLAIVVCDNLGLPREVCDEAKRLIREQSGLDGSQVMIASTHTHSAPTSGTETSFGPNGGKPELAAPNGHFTSYQSFLARRIADSVQIALQRLEPAKLGYGVGREPSEVFNRRWYIRDESDRRNPFGGVDQVRMNPPSGSPGLLNPAGPTDPDINFISVQSLEGRPIALLASYSLHYVGGVPQGVVSADYFGRFCARISQMISPFPASTPFVAMLGNGTSGDINNIDFRKKRPVQKPYTQMERVANRVAAEIYRIYQTLEHSAEIRLNLRYEELRANSRKPTAEMVERARTVLKRPAGTTLWHPREIDYARRVLQRAEVPDQVDLPLQVFLIGDVAIMATPVETFAETGLELKAKSPFRNAFVLSMANAYYGYMPSDTQHLLGGYESWLGTNRVERGTASRITTTLLRFLDEMKRP